MLVIELALAVPPTLTMLVVLAFTEEVTNRRILFASLAASSFLIYRAPLHPMNGARVMVAAHAVGVAVGTAAGVLFGPGYAAAAVAMTGCIVLLIVLRVVHPPAIATALGFAFSAQEESAMALFLLALGMVAVLVGLQRSADWTVRVLGLAPRP